MKGVIVEIRGDIAAMLSDDGCIVKVKNKKYEIGQEVEINMKKSFNFKKFCSCRSLFDVSIGWRRRIGILHTS